MDEELKELTAQIADDKLMDELIFGAKLIMQGYTWNELMEALNKKRENEAQRK